MKKRILALLLAGCVVFTGLPVNMYAGEGTEVYSEVTETREAAEYELIIKDNVVVGYEGTPVDVVIPKGVTGIKNAVFENCTTLTSITLSSTVKSIGGWAFHGCTNLSHIEIPSSVTEIGYRPFGGTLWLENKRKENPLVIVNNILVDGEISSGDVEIPSGVKRINNYAFYECSGLTSIKIPSSVTGIGDYAFSDCKGLTNIEIPISVKSFGEGAFRGCSSLRSIKIPSSVTRIEDYTFAGCRSLSSIEIPNSVASIGACAFSSCENLRSIKLPFGIKTIEFGTFGACSNLESIEIPRSVTAIEFRAFEGTQWLKNKREENPLVIVNNILIDGQTAVGDIKIPSGVKCIGKSAFDGCNGLTSVKIPSSVESIRAVAFRDCSKLISLDIPASVKSIELCAFDNCSSLKYIDIPSSVTNIERFAFRGTPWLENKRRENPLVIVNNILIDAQTTTGTVKIPSDVQSIGGGAFCECRDLKEVEILSSVKYIGSYAFSDCSSLRNIKIPNNVERIEEGTFSRCSNLEKIEIPNSVKTIENYAFNECTSLKRIEIPSSVTSIANYAFDECTNLKRIEIPSSVTSIGENAFNECNNLTIHGKRGSYVEKYAKENDIPFVATSKVLLKKATAKLSATSYIYDGKSKKPNVTVKIGNQKLVKDRDYTINYKNNKNIGTATVTIKGKGDYTGTITRKFTIKAKKGTTFTYGKNKYKIADSSTVKFMGITSSSSKKVTIPKIVKYGGKTFKVTAIEKNALKKKTKITSVVIGANIRVIGASAFEGCKNLNTITIKTEKLKTVGKNAFKNVNAKANIEVPKSKFTSYKKLLKGKGRGSKVKIVKLK